MEEVQDGTVSVNGIYLMLSKIFVMRGNRAAPTGISTLFLSLPKE